MKKMSRCKFLLLSLTWGLPMTLIGGVVMLGLIICGKKPKKWGYTYYIEVGKKWGGLELGMFFITNENPSLALQYHEFGHCIQNCYFGWLMPFIVWIPSAVRYWYRIIRQKLGYKNPGYNSIWFERQATELGRKYVERNGG